MVKSILSKWFAKRPQLHPAGTLVAKNDAPFPFIRVAGKDAAEARRTLAAKHPGHTAIIWGAPDQTVNLFEMIGFDDAPAVADVLTAAAKGTGVELLRAHRDESTARVKAYYAEKGVAYVEDEEPLPEDDGEPIDPSIQPHDRLIGFDDHKTGGPASEVVIGLVPTADAWEVPAYLKYGSWNDCPPAHVHTAFARDWYERYGARLVVATSDVLEFEVASPPTTDAEAMALAGVFETYCSDIVTQGVGSRRALAQTLKGGRFWYFWWD